MAKRLSPLTVAYVHSVLKSALEHAVREEELPRNVARNVKLSPPRPAPPPAVRTAHRQEQERQRTAAGAGWRENGMIFTTCIGTPLDPSDIARRFTGLLDQAGILRIRFHDLRHTCATLLLEQGVQLVTIKELLGHANIGITAQVYAHVRLRLQHDAINQLTDVLRDGDGPEDPPTATVSAN